MTIIEKLEQEALKFMAKRVPIEKGIKKSIYDELIKAKKEIENYILSLSNVNLMNMSYTIKNTIRSILNKYYLIQVSILEDVVSNSVDAGMEQGNRFITITKEETEPVLYNDKKEEYLALLLLYSKKLLEGLNEDLLNKLDKDMYSAYITSKTDELTGINGAIFGTAVLGFIDSTFDQFEKRANVISQTETNRALNTGVMLTLVSFKKNIDELKVKWVEVKDQKLCKYCRERANGGPLGDGVYDIDSVTPPPLHPNCRCILVPYLNSWG